MIVGENDPVVLGIPKHIGAAEEIVQRACGPKKEPRQPRRLMRTPGELQRVVSSDKPITVPFILFRFSDTIPTTSPERFAILLADTAATPLKNYYQEVLGKPFYVSDESLKTLAWYHGLYHDYYGQDFLGSGGQPGDDYLVAALVIKAVTEADRHILFSDYDEDGDCYVDMVMIVYQGQAQEQSQNPNDIWSHRWTLNDAMLVGDGSGEVTTHDYCKADPDHIEFMKVNAYTILPEILVQ